MQHNKRDSEELIVPVVPLHGFRSWGGSISVKGTTLFILCSFNLPHPPTGSRWRTWLQLGPIRNFFYPRIKAAAFPVSQARQLGYAMAFFAKHEFSLVDIVLNGHEHTCLVSSFPGVRGIYTAREAKLSLSPSSYDTIIVSYPDPLGIGWNGLEKKLLHEAVRPAIIINGRGRILSLTPETHHLLSIRRFLAFTRLFELFFGFAVVPLAAILALKDKLTGHSEKEKMNK